MSTKVSTTKKVVTTGTKAPVTAGATVPKNVLAEAKARAKASQPVEQEDTESTPAVQPVKSAKKAPVVVDTKTGAKKAPVQVSEKTAPVSKKAPAKKAEPEPVQTGASAHCRICGKPLTDPESIAAGIGAECARKGFTSEEIEARMEELELEELPADFISFQDALNACDALYIPRNRLLKAMGGNRGMDEPLSPEYQVRYYRGKRYLPKAVLKVLPKLKDIVGKPGRKPKAEKEVEPEPEPTPVKKAPGKKAEPPQMTFDLKPGGGLKKAPKTVAKSEPEPAPKKAVKKAGTKKGEDGLPVIDL